MSGARAVTRLATTLAAAGLFSAATTSLAAEATGPQNWNELQTPAALTQIGARGRFSEKKVDGAFRQDRGLDLSASLALGSHFAYSAGGGYGERRRTDEETVRVRERWNAGALFAASGGYDEGKIAFAVGLQLFDRPAKPIAEGVDPELFVARLTVSAGLRVGSALDLLGELSFQGETNRALREEEEQEFRRSYGVGAGLAWRTTDSLRLLLEARYTIPYKPDVDSESLAFRAYPGIIYALSPAWELHASLVFAIRLETELDRGFRFGVRWRL